AAIDPAAVPVTTAGPSAGAFTAPGANAVANPLAASGGVTTATNFADLVVGADPTTQLVSYQQSSGAHQWHLLPDGLIFRSFLAGPREPRISTHFHDNHLGGIEDSQTLWSGTVGGRRGLLRFGNDNPLRPTGFQIDIEGAALVRLNLDEDRDVDASDFRFGIPLTWGDERVQYEFGYYHLSSHIGDEFLVRNPGFVRVNYVRDVIKFGVSYYPVPQWRVYGQIGYSVFTSGGSEPWECQFGAEYSKPGVTTIWGTPFLAVNAHLREELDFGGDFTAQAGWLWRGKSGSTLRAALHYLNGDSAIYQFFDNYEEQIGFGLFYDF
ncbi:MAG: DUF1207 domain-containing protein, partial [Planctomycetota bacterium]